MTAESDPIGIWNVLEIDQMNGFSKNDINGKFYLYILRKLESLIRAIELNQIHVELLTLDGQDLLKILKKNFFDIINASNATDYLGASIINALSALLNRSNQNVIITSCYMN